jgi:hypothetical protein
MAQLSLSEANNPEQFEPSHYKDAMADSDADKWTAAMKFTNGYPSKQKQPRSQ